jgi:cytochrome c oxidase subunit 4
MSAHDHADHDHQNVKYAYVFAALCVFTGISWALDIVHGIPKAMVVALVLAVAVAKALCVMMFFMHLKFEGNWKYLILAPTSILATGLMIALAPDQALHYYTPDVPQLREMTTAADEQVDIDMHSDSPVQDELTIPATVQ